MIIMYPYHCCYYGFHLCIVCMLNLFVTASSVAVIVRVVLVVVVYFLLYSWCPHCGCTYSIPETKYRFHELHVMVETINQSIFYSNLAHFQ